MALLLQGMPDISLIDTHAHLYEEAFDHDIDAVVERALRAGVRRIVLPNNDLDSIQPLKALVARFPDLFYPAMGLHPSEVDIQWPRQLTIIEQELSHQRYCAVGEIGLDYYWDTTYAYEQQEAFRAQLDLALHYHLPALIHARNSIEVITSIILEAKYKGLRCVMHSFAGTQTQYDRLASRPNTWFGLGGISTFKHGLGDAFLRHLDLTKVVLETDSPYLAPVPHRGQRNESAYVRDVAQHLAQVRGINPADLGAITSQNAQALFGWPSVAQ